MSNAGVNIFYSHMQEEEEKKKKENEREFSLVFAHISLVIHYEISEINRQSTKQVIIF